MDNELGLFEQVRGHSLMLVTSASMEPLRPLDRERDAAVKRVQDAFAQGQISYQDLDDRLHAVLTARAQNELLAAIEALPIPDEGRVVRIVATDGKIRRSGAWHVPNVLYIESDFGSVGLDFSRAVFETPVVDVELRLRFGGAKITVPEDAVIDLDALRTEWKQPRYSQPRLAPIGGPVIRISGYMQHGRLRLQHRRR